MNDTDEEMPMDQVVLLAFTLLNASQGLVSILGDDQLIYRSIFGLDPACVPNDVSVTRKLVEMGRGAHLDIPDAQADIRFCEHPLVTGPTALRSYVGATISTSAGVPIGSLAVMATTSRNPCSKTQIDALKRLARMAGDIYDQTERQRAQEEQLQKLTLAEEMSGVGHWRVEPATGKLNWSSEAYRIHGVEPGDEPLTMEFAARLYHPDDRETLERLLIEGVATGETYRLRIVRPDGETRITRASARCERDNSGTIVAMFGVIQDVTDRENEHTALLKSENDYRLLADNIGDVVARMRLNGRIDYMSPASIELLGWRPDELVGTNAKAFVHPDDWHAFRALIVRRSRGDSGTRIQHRAVKRDGQLVWVETDCQLIPSALGGRPELVLMARDISDRKKLEEESSAARLRAEAADKAKSEFLANMSHELRTPLTSVVGFSGILLKSPSLSESDRQYARRIATASDVLLGVINDILDYSKLEADAVEIDDTVFDPRAMAEGAASIIETQCESRGVAMVLDISPDLPKLLVGDVTKLRQVMLNFLSNAVKFTHRGEILLALGGCLKGDNWALRVAVSDTGVGIPQEKIGQLFERFTQADVSTTRVYGGTGLGLAISRRLIELVDGKIGAEARPGGGSTFWFEVPLSISTEGRRVKETPSAGLPPGVRVLLADDTAPNRELVSVILRSLGVEVDAVCDGDQAVKAVSEGEYDLILMDVHMPVMDGLEATRSIRAMSGGKSNIPIIALTANIQPEQVERCRDAGMNDHVGKPIQVSELVRAMALVLTSSQTASDSQAIA